MTMALLLTVYCICVFAASLVGGALPMFVRITHRRMQLAMSFVGGLMLGVALLHLVPHALAHEPSADRVVGWMLGGLLAMFLIIRIFHVHAHEHGDTSDIVGAHATSQHVHCEHDHAHSTDHAAQHPFSWIGLGFGLSLHYIMDGAALGAAVIAEANGQHEFALFGLGTFLAVTLHKPLDAVSITSLMAAGAWSRSTLFWANLCFAMLSPLGAIAAAWGLGGILHEQSAIVGCALAFAAGVFLCIALADLLPEVAFHAHDRFSLTAALLLGIGLAWSIGFFEPAHSHPGEHDHHHEHSGH